MSNPTFAGKSDRLTGINVGQAVTELTESVMDILSVCCDF